MQSTALDQSRRGAAVVEERQGSFTITGRTNQVKTYTKTKLLVQDFSVGINIYEHPHILIHQQSSYSAHTHTHKQAEQLLLVHGICCSPYLACI